MSIRDTLFGDGSLDQWPTAQAADAVAQVFPWSAFITARKSFAAGDKDQALAAWQQIAESPGLEPRHYLQAWHFLRQQGHAPSPDVAKRLLGVVVEVALNEGLDLLAAYPDHSARYYNYSGAGVVWEHPDASLDPVIDELLQASARVVVKIGPWEKARPAMPPAGHVRLSFLTSSGLHFGQGAMDVISRDPLGGEVLHKASNLMQALIAKSQTR